MGLAVQGGLRGTGYRFQCEGKGTQGVQKTLRVVVVRKAFSLKTKCQRVINYVFSFVLNSSANWTWNVGNARVLHRWETKILRSTFRPTMQQGEELVAYKARTARMLRTRWKKLGLPS